MRRLPTSPPSAASDAMADLNTDIRYIKGIGETRAKALHKLGIATLGDLLSYFPRRWEDRTLERPIRELPVGRIRLRPGHAGRRPHRQPYRRRPHTGEGAGRGR